MNFAEQLPSQQWSFLKLKGLTIAEVWFKPEGEPFGLVFRVRRNSFEIQGIGQRLTMQHLLKAVSITPDQVESLRYGTTSNELSNRVELDMFSPLPKPWGEVAHLEIHLRLRPMPVASPHEVSGGQDDTSAHWQELELGWKAILGLEATIEAARKSVEAIRAELEASMRMTLSTEEKTHALAADVAQWNKAKNRAHYAVPKANEFIHRATWTEGAPERKMLSDLFKDPTNSQTSLLSIDHIQKTIEILRKDRQVLSAQGNSVYQECKNLVADVQGSLRRLQSNAMTRAAQKKGGIGLKRKSY